MPSVSDSVAVLLQAHAARAAFDQQILTLVKGELEQDRKKKAMPEGLTAIAFYPQGAFIGKDEGFITLAAGANLRLYSEVINYAHIRVHAFEVLADSPIPLCVQGSDLQAGGTPTMILGEGWTPLEVWRQASPALRFNPELRAPNQLSIDVRNTGTVDVRVRIQAKVQQVTDDTFGSGMIG